MKGLMHSSVGIALGLLLLLSGTVHARQHRATRLGHPATRFAPYIDTTEELRSRFRDPKLKPDFANILRQMNWPGDPEDMHRAAATAEVIEIKLPVGTVMPFMSSRENGRPVALREVVWAGDEPVGAYEFFFSSRGRRYRCVLFRDHAHHVAGAIVGRDVAIAQLRQRRDGVVGAVGGELGPEIHADVV